jgi:hypothetical protein
MLICWPACLLQCVSTSPRIKYLELQTIPTFKSQPNKMRKLFFVAIAAVFLQHTNAQINTDSLDKQLKNSKTDTARDNMLRSFSQTLALQKPDSALAKLLKLKAHFELSGNQQAQGWILTGISLSLTYAGNYEDGTAIGLQSLKIFELIKDTLGIMNALNTTAISIAENGDRTVAIQYFKRNLDYNSLFKNDHIRFSSKNNIADCYLKLDQPDSALPYLSSVMENSSNVEPYFLGIILGNYGEYYEEKKEYDLAFPYLRKSFSNLVIAKDFFDQSTAYNDMAGIYFEQQQYDSSRYYAYHAVELAAQDHFNQPLMKGYDILYKNYERGHRSDSAFKYLKLQLATKDSMFSEEKQKKVQGLAFAEQIREQEIATKEAIAEKNHKQTIETAAIGAGILIFIIFFLLYSNSIVASPRLIRFLGVIALIVMFEFLYLVLDRYIMQFTNDSTLIMLLVWVVLAAALSPLDEFMNEWVKHRLVEKNKKIKIAAAHKVLDKLEAAE